MNRQETPRQTDIRYLKRDIAEAKREILAREYAIQAWAESLKRNEELLAILEAQEK